MVERWIFSRGVGSNPAFSFLLFKINLVPLQLSAKRDRWQGRHARMYSRKQYPFRSHDLTKFLHKSQGTGVCGRRTKEKLLSGLINQAHIYLSHKNTRSICYLQYGNNTPIKLDSHEGSITVVHEVRNCGILTNLWFESRVFMGRPH